MDGMRPTSDLSFVTLLSYDYGYAYDAITSYYDIADEVILGLDEKRLTWRGEKFDIDMAKINDFIKKTDTNNKIKIIEGDFYKFKYSMNNDTLERNYLSGFCNSNNWIISIDADERILNANEFKDWMDAGVDPKKSITGSWDGVFKVLPEGDIVINASETTVVGVKEANAYIGARETGKQKIVSPLRLLHYSWGRSEHELWQKLSNWSHSQDFDVKKFFEMWKSIDANNYHTFKNIHPLDGISWPSLSLRKKP